MKDFEIRIGGAWMAVKAKDAPAALHAAVTDYGYAIIGALENGSHGVIKRSESNKRVTISIRELSA